MWQISQTFDTPCLVNNFFDEGSKGGFVPGLLGEVWDGSAIICSTPDVLKMIFMNP